MSDRMPPKDFFAIGIDPSIAGTCVCLGSSPKSYRIEKFPSSPSGRSVRARIDRIEQTVSRVMRWIESSPELTKHQYPLLLIEGYSFGSKQGGEYLAEYGGVLRWHLMEDFDAYEVAPTQLRNTSPEKAAERRNS